MARALSIAPKTYDEAKLASMVPPFTVRVEKIRGSARTPIPMPESDDGSTPGTNWSLEDVKGIESWLVTEWAGGGLYEVTVIDSSPQPQKMQWQPMWDTKLYPERTPPPLVEASSAMAPPPPPVLNQPPQFSPPQPPGRFMPAFPHGLPPGYQPPQYAQQGYYAPPALPNPPMPGTHQWDAYQREVERRERENREREREAELRREREAREKMERDVAAAKHAAELERERQANEARFQAQATQMNELRMMITQLTSSIKEGAATSRVSPEIEQLREQNRMMEARAERERLEREAERREVALRDMIKSMQDSTKAQVEMLQRQFDERTRALEVAARDNKAPDQMMMMWQQSQREQMELSKELSRNQLSQMQALQAYMMNPRDVMAMAKESSASVDQATDRVTRFFGQVIDTQQKVTENLLQMQPQGNGVVEIVGSSVEKLGTLAERYLGGKQMEAQLNAQVQVQTAEAQARAYGEAVRAQAAQQAQPTPVASPVAATSGLGTPPPVANDEQQAKPKKARKAKAAAAAAAPTDPNVKRLGKTDHEWFGMLMPQIETLRSEAGSFIESIKSGKAEKTGKPDGWDPEHTAVMLSQAIGFVVQRQIEIPIMTDLLFQNRFADFVDVLLPDPYVTQQYRDEVVQHLIRIARQGSGLPPEAEGNEDRSVGDDTDDDDDESDDDGEELDADDDDGDHDDPEGDRAQDGKPVNGKGSVVPIAAVKPKAQAPAPRRA